MEEVFRFTFISPPKPVPADRVLRLQLSDTRVGVLLSRAELDLAALRADVDNLLGLLEEPAPEVVNLLRAVRRTLLAGSLDEPDEPINICSIAEGVIGTALAAWLGSPSVQQTQDAIIEHLAARKFASPERGQSQDLYEAYVTLALLDDAVSDSCEMTQQIARARLRRIIEFDNPLRGRLAQPEGGDAADAGRDTPATASSLTMLLNRRALVRSVLDDLARLRRSDLTVRTASLDPDGRLAMMTVASADELPEAARSRARLYLRAESHARLPERTRAFLEDVELSATEVPLTELRIRVEEIDRLIERELAELARAPRLAALATPITMQPFGLGLGLAAPPMKKVPDTVGFVQPIGVGRLQVTMQQLKRYEGGDLAHVENVMLGQRQERRTRRLERIEDIFTQEEETTREEERDRQSTTRNEMQSAVEETLSENQSFRVGGSISGGYGPFVQAEISTNFETSSSSESTSRNAATYAREIMEKTSFKVAARTRELRTITTIYEFEENNIHEFNNIEGEDHISGLFQWLNRVYEAQVYDFGVRVFFDIMVPEPAAFWQQVVEYSSKPRYDIAEPTPFDLRFTDITRSNYKVHAAEYGVTDVSLPPPEELVLYVALLGDAVQDQSSIQISQEVTLPSGFAPREYRLKLYIDSSAPDDAQFHMDGLSVQVGRHSETFPPEEFNPDDFQPIAGTQRAYLVKGSINPTLDADFHGTLPVNVLVKGADRVHGIMEIRCADQTAFATWQLDTWQRLLSGYRKVKSDHDDRLAELQTQDVIVIEGGNPLENQRIQEDELRRAAISIISGQYFELFSAILESGTMEARVDFAEAEAEGRYAQFFEDAFEWDRMEYTYYPYYWARRSTWIEKLIASNPDPLFASFLKASFAKVRVAVRPDFEQALFHFLETGVVWRGGDLPPVTDRAHVAMLDEVRERRANDRHHQAVEVGAPFDIWLPTTLVWLRPGATLPSWSKNRDGEWVADEP